MANYLHELEKAAIDLLVTYRDREIGDPTQVMTVPQGIAALAEVMARNSPRGFREDAAAVLTFITEVKS